MPVSINTYGKMSKRLNQKTVLHTYCNMMTVYAVTFIIHTP